MKDWRRLLGAAVMTAGLWGCASDDAGDSLEPTFKTAEEGYNMALDQLQQRQYKSAISTFEDVERLFPYSPWAVRAPIMTAYANYRRGEYETAMAVLERFVRLHPGNQMTPYAYYLLAMCSYEQITDVGRDQKMTEAAQAALTEVVKRFPNTEYARDAKLKLDLTEDHLAGKEMEIGRYYLKRQDYLAAVNRFRYVVENFQTTSHVPEALHRLVEANLSLGLVEEARRDASVLGHNFPGSDWYRRSFALIEDLPVKPAAAPVAETAKPAVPAPGDPEVPAAEVPRPDPVMTDLPGLESVKGDALPPLGVAPEAEAAKPAAEAAPAQAEEKTKDSKPGWLERQWNSIW